MHPYLTKLGVPTVVQCFFEPYYTADETGNLVFSYGEEAEHFGFAFHRVPAKGYWMAGNSNLSMISHVFICDSAMEAVSYFSLNYHSFRQMDQCLFVAGDPVFKLTGKSCALIFGKDILGNVRDLITAAKIRNMPLSPLLTENGVQIHFRHKNYYILQHDFSLSAFEKFSGYRFGVRVCKSKSAGSWLDQLKSNIF